MSQSGPPPRVRHRRNPWLPLLSLKLEVKWLTLRGQPICSYEFLDSVS